MLITNQGISNNSGYADSTDFLKKPDLTTLNGYYTDADSIDQGIYAEMRSNILLASGDHYTRRTSTFYRRIRDNRELTQEQKIRLTKNHVQKICKLYSNNILSVNPGIGFTPKDENSMHDQKVAQLHHSVWLDAMERYNLCDKYEDWCDSFVQIGEVHVKLFYDPALGDLEGFEPQTDPETGNPSMNEFQQPIPDESKPVFTGEFVFEEIYGFNLLRPPECKDLRKAEWLGIRKMVDKQELQRRFQDQPDLLSKIRSDSDETYMIFDALNGGYKKTNKQTMIREYYFRPSLLFPRGYFYITTKDGILGEGELPGGLFPIVSALFEKVQTTPRGRSGIKTMRPYQAEINRSASKMAEHQITLGDDKLLLQNGTKVSAGASLPGIRAVNYTGSEPKILAGRDGSQYLQYMQTQIAEMYQVMMVAEMDVDSDAKLDPYVLLFRSAKQKKKFQRYISRFEKFLKEICYLYLRLAKIHLPDDAVIWAIGKNEQVNIEEFRALPDTCYEIKIEAQADDIETKLGKQIVINHALQYVGPQLKPDDIGKIMRQMPFANFDQTFDDLTIDYDTAMNDMLALDRGETPPINQYDNHVYMIKRLTARTRKADYKGLPPPVQNNYTQKIAMHQQFEAANQAAIQRAESGFIPTDGYLVVCDFYVKDPTDTTGVKTRRARVPYGAMQWLLQKLDDQGNSQDSIQDMNGGAQAQLADAITKQNPASQVGGPQGTPSAGLPPPRPMLAMGHGAPPMGGARPPMSMQRPPMPPPGGAPRPPMSMHGPGLMNMHAPAQPPGRNPMSMAMGG